MSNVGDPEATAAPHIVKEQVRFKFYLVVLFQLIALLRLIFFFFFSLSGLVAPCVYICLAFSNISFRVEVLPLVL